MYMYVYVHVHPYFIRMKRYIDRPFETIQNFHFQKCPVLPFKSIQMVLEGPLIHHLEVSKQGFVLHVAVLPFGKMQTRFCIR